ncbi:hypothetical protein BGZ83_009547 [Gryganskiella cystojenkinii]|nr:hypothetical protein BGZ83_009547 [Gryganskiella cystojenkinii]
MASLLFDDITFPRELYDPDTLDFVAPVSTLLAFTPHILSQLAKTSEDTQEPLPGWQPRPQPSPSQVKDEGNNPHNSTTTDPSPTSSSGLFSSFANLASSHGTQRILENGLYLAGRYMDGRASSASSTSFSSGRAYERELRDQERDRERSQQHQGSYWFGASNNNQRSFEQHREQERARVRELEDRLLQMERDLYQNTAMARSEIEQQRRERLKLEQELEVQKSKLKKLEQEMEDEQKKREKEKKDQQERDIEEKKRQEKEKENEKVEREAEETKKKLKEKEKRESSKDGDAEDKNKALTTKKSDDTALAAKAVLIATVGVASLVMSLYSAHKASSTYSVVTFHDQLEQLMQQCEGVIQSTEAWISEQFLEVPDQVREDVRMIKELMETIQRLDPRSEKKAETVAWSMSAVGSLGAVGGVVIGSTMAIASGGTLVVGCALYGVITRARYNGPEYSAARSMMELHAVKTLRALGVNPSSPSISPSTTSSATGGRATLTPTRLERLRIEFERREGHDLRDADEIDGLAVEEAMKKSSFAAPFVSQKKRASVRIHQEQQEQESKLATLLSSMEQERPLDERPHLTMKRAVATA